MAHDSAKGVRLEHVYVLFTDIVGSTGRWESTPDAMRAAMRVHDELVTAAIVESGGAVLKRTGDGAVGTFRSAEQAVGAATELQRVLAATAQLAGIGVRMGIHCGRLERRLGDLHGPEMHRAARIMSAAHGGQILVSRAIRDQCEDTVELRRLGSYQLRGLLRPVELFQVVGHGLPAEFPPPNATMPEVGNLPLLPATIVGRADEIDDVVSSIGSGRLTTLTGPGGVGKTRLALHVARAVCAEYGGGAWFVDLAALTVSSEVPRAIAASLGVAGGPLDQMFERVVERCSSAATLLVVDNCEHLAPGVADTVALLIASAPSATVLCTSQRRLGCSGERVLALGPLPVERAADGGRSPAVELFHQRAGEARGGEDLSGFDEVVGRICRELDGLPLAIELAAARCAVMDPDELSARLGDRFGVLRRRDGVARHRTLDAVIGWSYDLLDDDEQRQLRALSVFHGPFDLAAAATVSNEVSDDDVVDAVAELVDRSLVRRTAQGLTLLDSVRHFAAARRRAAGEDDRLVARHAQWVASLASGPVDDPDAEVVDRRLTQLRARAGDIRAGIETMIGADPDQAAAAVIGLTDYWIASDVGAEPADMLERIVPQVVRPASRVAADTVLACFGWLEGRNDVAESAARRALDTADRAGLPFPVFAASRLVVHLAFSGELGEAMALAERTLAQLTDDHPERARIRGAIAVAFAVAGDLARAVDLADAGVAAAREDGAIRLMAALSNRLVVTAGSPETAALADELAELAVTLGRHSAAAQAMITKAHCTRAAGDHEGFLATLAASARVMYLTGQRTQLVNTLDYAPGALHDLAEHHAAATMLGASARLRSEVGLAASSVLPLDHIARRVHEVLGPAEHQRRFASGEALTMEQAVEFLDAVAAARSHSAAVG